MANFMDRLPILVELHTQGGHREIIRRNAADSIKDRNGCCSTSVADDLRFFGIADYLLRGDIKSFRSQLSESARVQVRLFERFENGEPIDGSYVTMLSYKSLFDALAVGDMSLAKSLAQHMGGRDDLEREHDHPFDYAVLLTSNNVEVFDKVITRRWR